MPAGLFFAVPVVVPRSARSVVRSAAMQARAPRSGRRSVASPGPPAEAPPAPPAHVTDEEENGMTLTRIALAVVCSAAFAGPLAAQQSGTSDAKVAPTKWAVERVRCSDLLSAADDDRASAAMFYFGYLAAKDNIHVIDVSKIEDNIGKVMKQCSATPSMMVPQAFRQALHSHKG
jgi:hypothetical protein